MDVTRMYGIIIYISTLLMKKCVAVAIPYSTVINKNTGPSGRAV